MGSLFSKKKNRKKTKEKPKSPQIEEKEIKIHRNLIKLALLGDSAVGKSTICRSFLKIDYLDDYSLIVQEKVEKNISLNNGKNVKLILWDTAGQERFRAAAFKTVKSVDGIIIVFDVTNRHSFDNLEKWLSDIKDNCYDPAIILFGNKVDIGEDSWGVSREEIEKFVKVKKLKYFEISAKNRTGIDEGVSYLANTIYSKMENEFILL